MVSMAFRVVILTLSFIAPHVLAAQQDGPVDWRENPDGMPEVLLRSCALRPFSSNSYYSIDRTFCSLNACVCRNSFTERIHKHIKEQVEWGCGNVRDDPSIQKDVDEAIQIYHDYCASKGYPISSSSTEGGGPTSTGSSCIATVTVFINDAGVLPAPVWARLISRLEATRKSLRLGIKTSTSWLSPAWLLVLVLLVSALSFASQFGLLAARSLSRSVTDSKRTAPDPDTTSSAPSDPEKNTPDRDGNTSKNSTTNKDPTGSESDPTTPGGPTNQLDNSGKQTSSPGGKSELSTLEIVGIVLGIIFAVITTIATVYMCWRMKAKAKTEA